VTLEQFDRRQDGKRDEGNEEKAFDPERTAHFGITFLRTELKVA
jgi:hypothetical protein